MLDFEGFVDGVAFEGGKGENYPLVIGSGSVSYTHLEQAEKMSDIRGEVKEIGFGSQIRSYVMQPYTLVKDHRTNTEISNVGAVMDLSLIHIYIL